MKHLGVWTAYSRLILIELIRTPSYVIPSVMFPTMFYCIFALPYAKTAAIADLEMLSFVAFAVIGVTLFQFGVGVAMERGRPWERYLRTLPAHPLVRFAARVNAALVFGIVAGGLVAFVARIFTPVDLVATQWIVFAVYAALGGIPFILLGLAIGYWCNAKAAVPIANVVYLLLSFAGGLWVPVRYLPSFAAVVSPFLPTRQYGELLWSIVTPASAPSALLWLLGYSFVFLGLASLGYRRDERARYA